ncbi:MAG: fimbria/pilus outer membrane usher protein [Rhodobacterales bacterium]
MFRSRGSRLGKFGAIICAQATIAMLVLAVGQADSQEQVESGIPLYLEVFINGAPTNLITRFTALNDGALSADADELRNTGISPGAHSVRGEVRLNDVPGLNWEIIAGDQEIHFDLNDSDRAARVISAARKEEESETMPRVEAGYGVVLNYDVSLAAEGAVGTQLDPLAAGRFDARLFSPFGSLSHGFTLSDAGYGTATYRRLDTNWRSDFPERAIEIQIGDIITTGPSWARPVRMGGVSVRRNFGLRPDLVTIPLPEFEGSAAVPSTVEIYAGAVRRYAVDVPAGPFALTDLPFPVGTTDAQIVLRDVTGRETRIDLPFLVSADLLRPGMADYALSFGQPRLGTGTQNDRYIGEGFLSGSIRYGVSSALTLSGHFELGEDLRLAGLGTTFRLGDRTTISTSYAHSRSGVDQGHLVEASAELNFGNLRIQGRTLRSWGVFNDIAMVSAEPDFTDMVFSQITELDQLSINMAAPWHDAGQLSVFASQTKDQSFGNERTLGVSYAQPFLQNGTLFLSALALRGQTTDNVVQAGISFPLGAKSRTTVTADTRRAGGRLTASASGEAGADGAGWRWRTVGVLGEDTTAQLAVSRELALGQVEIVARRSPASQGESVMLFLSSVFIFYFKKTAKS